MILFLLAALPLSAHPAPAPPPSSPYDRVLDLELRADDEALVEGHGPTSVVEYEVEFEGTLHLWATSELDLFLQVDDAVEGRTLARDEDSGGGTTPYLTLDAHPGDWLVIFVAGKTGSAGPLTLHLMAAPDTEAGRAAETATRDALRAAQQLTDGRRESDVQAIMAKALPEDGSASEPEHLRLLTLRMDLASRMRALGKLGEARRLNKSAVAGLTRILPRRHDKLLRAQYNLGSSLMRAGAVAEARDLLESVLAGFEANLPRDHPNVLRVRTNLALSMHALGEIAGARALRESILEDQERSLPEDHPDLLAARSNLATSLFMMGDLAGALALRESAAAGYARVLPENHPDLLSARGNLAVSMQMIGDEAGARSIRESVLSGFEQILPEDHPHVALSRANLALSLDSMGDFAGARALKEVAVANYERTRPEDHPALLLARMNLANSMKNMGDHAEARALSESVVAGYKRVLPEDHPDLLLAQGNLANFLQSTGDLPAALALKKSVLASYERLLPETHTQLLLARRSLVHSMIADGDLDGARELVPAQMDGMGRRIAAALALAPRQAQQAVAAEAGRMAQVLSLTGSADSDLERKAFELTETLRLVAAESPRSLARFDTDPELAPILEQAAAVRRALNDLVAGAGRDEAGSEGLTAELTRLSLERDALEGEASRRLAERGVVTEGVSAPALTEALGPTDLAIAYRRISLRHVDPSTGELGPSADHLLAHTLDSAGRLARVDLGPASALEDLANEWRATLGAPLLRGLDLEDEEDREVLVGRNLRARILDPALESSNEDIRRLFICADDLLFLLPLDALPMDEGDADGAARLGDRLHIVNEVSFARLMAPTTDLPGSPSMLAFGGIDYDARGAAPEGLTAASAPIEADDADLTARPDDLDPHARGTAPSSRASENPDETSATRSAFPERFRKLRQARYEAEATADIFEESFDVEADLLLGADTTKAALFEAAPGKRYLHIATHGWFASETVRSTADAPATDQGFARMDLQDRVTGLAPMTLCGLALAGANNGRDSLGRVPGILTAEELCSLDLSQCELAVLSACETNVGIRRAGQGIQSLQSALYAAGARTSITSLWKVDDAATRRLMEAFYDNLWVQGMGKAEALWQAKQTLRDAGDPPAHWAGWVLTGDPD